jgi:hypothetical protein
MERYLIIFIWIMYRINQVFFKVLIMEPGESEAEIAALQIELHHLEKKLDGAIKNNERYAKTKSIFLEMKSVAERIGEIKRMQTNNGN